MRFREGTDPEILKDFDKIVVCVGESGKPKLPQFAGTDIYKGKIIHSQSFKCPNNFDGKSVVVLGIGNNAADISTALVVHASKIYLAHQRGANIVS